MIYLLDTSVLKWAYIPGKYHHRCRYILRRCRGSVYIAEISILELLTPLGHEVRSRRMSLIQFQRANRLLLKDIAEGLIVVRAFPPAELIPCRYMLTLVGITEGRGLKSLDGIVAYTARRLAVDEEAPR